MPKSMAPKEGCPKKAYNAKWLHEKKNLKVS